jgi:hypothetical protein
MQLMMQGNSAPPMPEQYHAPAPSSGFNFTYIKEGEEQPQAAPQHPVMMLPMQPGTMMSPYHYAQMMPPMYGGPMNADKVMTGPQSPQVQPSNPKSRPSTTPSSKKASMVPSVVVKSKK